MPQFPFNATQYDPRYDALGGMSAGKHKVIIQESSFKPTKDSQPHDPRNMLVFKLADIENGSSMDDRLNIQNPSLEAVNIAHQQLAAYCAVVGKQGFNATEELHNIPFIIEVGPQPNNDKYMEVKAIFDIYGNKPGEQRQPISPLAQATDPAPGQVYTAPQQFQPVQAGVAPGYSAQPQQASQPPFNPRPTSGFAPAAGGAAPWGARK